MLSLGQFLRSKTVWATAATFLFNGLQSVHPVVSPADANTINLLLMGVIAGARAANTQNKT